MPRAVCISGTHFVPTYYFHQCMPMPITTSVDVLLYVVPAYRSVGGGHLNCYFSLLDWRDGILECKVTGHPRDLDILKQAGFIKRYEMG